MSGIFNTLNTVSKGLIAQQTALHTVGHNLSNANTDGFSRQRVELKSDLAFNFAGVGQLGTGVKMEAIVRMIDDYVSKQIRKENASLQGYTVKSEVMGQLEIIFNEPSDTGLNFALGEMFDAWQELSKNPESLNSKTIVVEKSRTLTDTINHMATQLESLKDETKELIEKNILDFNTIVEQLDSLNKQIFNVSVKGQTPNDLLDERDLMLKRLSSISNIEVEYDRFDRVSIRIGAEYILKEDKPYMKKENDFFIDNDILNPDIKAGQIKGYSEAMDEIDGRIKELDEVAVFLTRVVNEAHNDGWNSDCDFFVSGSAEDIKAINIQINEDIVNDTGLVRAGENEDSPIGDGSKALIIAGLRNAKAKEEDGAIVGSTLEGSYRDMVIRVGISKEHADNMAKNQEVLLKQLVLRRESTSGVSIDEEVTNLIKFQRAYDANARVIAVLSEMLDTLINRTGV